MPCSGRQLVVKQYSPLGALLKNQNCLQKMLVKPEVFIRCLEGIQILQIRCLSHVVILDQLSVKYLGTSQAFRMPTSPL